MFFLFGESKSRIFNSEIPYSGRSRDPPPTLPLIILFLCLDVYLACGISVSAVYGAVATPSELTIVTDLVKRGPLRGILNDKAKRDSLTPDIRRKIMKVGHARSVVLGGPSILLGAASPAPLQDTDTG